jgi:hypothetical protein
MDTGAQRIADIEADEKKVTYADLLQRVIVAQNGMVHTSPGANQWWCNEYTPRSIQRDL